MCPHMHVCTVHTCVCTCMSAYACPLHVNTLAQDYYSKRQMQVKDADGGPIYHLHSLKETPEGCLLAMEGKFSAYRTQAEEYRQDCIEGILCNDRV